MDRKTIWEQLVAKKDEFIGGTLEDYGDRIDSQLGINTKDATTTITDITYKPNEAGHYFSVHGINFDCGFDTRFGGIASGKNGKLLFTGFAGHSFMITKPDPVLKR